MHRLNVYKYITHLKIQIGIAVKELIILIILFITYTGIDIKFPKRNFFLTIYRYEYHLKGARKVGQTKGLVSGLGQGIV